MKLKDIKPNESNPRIIKDEKFKKLVNSIREFPAMMELRPMVVDAQNVVLGGNMRLKALQELGYSEIPDTWVKRASDLTDEEKQRFIIADNVGFGEWDWQTLANDWDAEKLNEWGLDVPGFDVNIQDYADKNKEINMDDMNTNMSITLKYTEEEYWQVKEALSKIASTPEQAVYKLLGYE